MNTERPAAPPPPASDAAGEPPILTAIVPDDVGSLRLDRVLADLFPDYSRSRLKTWIDAGRVLVNGRPAKPRDLMQGGEQLEVRTTAEAQATWQAQSAAQFRILYSDEDIIVIDKPAGVVVHPGAGNGGATLANALLHDFPEVAALPRAGIVHRIDKDTSGLLVVARSQRAQTRLTRQLQDRSVSREYEAVAAGVLISGGTVDAPIDRSPRDRTRMAVIEGGRESVTHYRVIERFRAHTHIRVQLETGRTHQIRVHMAHIKHPLFGDPVYGGRLQLPRGATAPLIEAMRTFHRQALHAARLSLIHPGTGEEMSWTSPLPEDMQKLLAILRADAKAM